MNHENQEGMQFGGGGEAQTWLPARIKNSKRVEGRGKEEKKNHNVRETEKRKNQSVGRPGVGGGVGATQPWFKFSGSKRGGNLQRVVGQRGEQKKQKRE